MLIAFSRIGLAFQSVREDEDAAESLGINVRNYKILAFTLSAFFAGIAGGLYAQWFNYVSPTYLESAFSFQVIIMCVIGGIGTITGGVVGAFLLIILVPFLSMLAISCITICDSPEILIGVRLPCAWTRRTRYTPSPIVLIKQTILLASRKPIFL